MGEEMMVPGGTPERRGSGWVFAVCWLAWIAAIVVPALLLGFAVPAWRLWILLLAGALVFAFPGYTAGSEWASVPPRMRRDMLWMSAIIIPMPTGYDFAKAVAALNGREVLHHLVFYAVLGGGMLAGFLLGRRRARRPASGADA